MCIRDRHYYNAKEAHYKAQSDVNQSILALEELIGVAWEKVLPKREVLEKRNRSRGN